jgi:hypothetical protein
MTDNEGFLAITRKGQSTQPAPPPVPESPNIQGLSSSDEAVRKVRGLESAYDAIQAHPPKLQQIPEPKAQETDPLKMWGSAAMIIASLASLKTRQPLTTAMNAAASVMQGYAKGDKEATERAFQTWKVATENASAIYKSQYELYKNILSGIEHKEKTEIGLQSLKERETYALLGAMARSNHDHIMADLAERRLGVQIDSHMEKMKKAHDKLVEGYGKSIELKNSNEAIRSMVENPEDSKYAEYQSASPARRARMVRDMLPAGDKRRQSIEDAQKKHDDAARRYWAMPDAKRQEWDDAMRKVNPAWIPPDNPDSKKPAATPQKPATPALPAVLPPVNLYE